MCVNLLTTYFTQNKSRTKAKFVEICILVYMYMCDIFCGIMTVSALEI